MRTLKQLLFTAALFVIFTAVNYSLLVQAAPPGQTASTFTNIRVTQDLDVDRDLNVDDDAVIDDDVTIGGSVAITGVANLADTDSVVTGTQTITPTYSYLQVSPQAAVLTMTLATGSAADGDFLIVHNLLTTNTVIVDTGATAGGGNITLGQDDVAGFIFGDGVWIELFSPDNS